ncbi:MAG: zinc metalloprotease HtpX [Thermoplasmata archaeon]|nr:zinc metalloprotease HtpX [Thermoplasmata archaeon]
MLSRLRTLGLFAMLMLIFMAMGAGLGTYFGTAPMGTMIVFLIIAGIFNLVAYFWSDKFVLRAYKARIIEGHENPLLHEIVREIAVSAGVPKPRVAIVPSQNPNAFATGRNPKNAVVAVTEGILRLLSKEELKGVLAHEMAHVKNRDILVMCVAATIAGAVSFMARILWFNMFFGGRRDNSLILYLLVGIPAIIGALLVQMAISRSREYKADRTGAIFIHNPDALARALEKLHYGNQRHPMRMGGPASSSLFIVNPFSGSLFATMFSTHPPMEKRIRALREMRDY